MASPAYVNAGAVLNNGTAATATPALPGSRSNGNILIAVAVSRSTGTNTVSGTGWNAILENVTGGSGGTQTRVSAYYYIVNGSEASPTINGMGGSNIAQIFQWSGTASSPIGATDTGTASSGTSVTDSGVTTTRNNSRVIYIFGQRGGTLSTPSGYTEDSDGGTTNGCAITVGGVDVATSGTGSGSISATATTNAAWALLTIELMSPATTGSTFASMSC